MACLAQSFRVPLLVTTPSPCKKPAAYRHNAARELQSSAARLSFVALLGFTTKVGRRLRHCPRCNQAGPEVPRGDAWLEATQFPRHLWSLTDSDLKDLRQGLRVQKQERMGKKGWGFVRIDVNAPKDLVMECLTDFDAYPKTLNAIRANKITSLEDTADGTRIVKCQHSISRFWFQIPVVYNLEAKSTKLRFEVDPAITGLVTKEASGFWQVVAEPKNCNACRVLFRVYVQASNLVPGWLIEYGAQRILRRATSWLKPHVEELWSSRSQKASENDGLPC